MIFDTDGLPAFSTTVGLGPNDQKTATIDIECKTGFSLKGTAVSGVTVEAKQEDAVSWTNIETTPIDLTTWAGTTERFLVRFTTASVTSFDRVTFTLTVEPS